MRHLHHPKWVTPRISERMSCEESAISFENIAYIPHIRQNHSTFPDLATKINLRKVISTEVPGIRLSPNVSTTFSKS